MSNLAIVGLAVGGAGAGTAYALSHRGAGDRPAATVTGITASATGGGIQAVTDFTFSVQAATFDASSVTYRWELGDGTTTTEATPTHVYASAGTYTVTVTVSDAKQSVRSETIVRVFSVQGAWYNGFWGGGTTLNLTQVGAVITGTENLQDIVSCPVSGIIQSGSPQVVITRPQCPQPGFLPLAAGEYRLSLTTDGTEFRGQHIDNRVISLNFIRQ